MIIQGLYDIAYYMDKSTWTPVVLIFHRNQDSQKKVIAINDYKPYIYLSEETFKEQLEYLNEYVDTYEKTNKKFILDNSKKLIKVFLKSPFDAYKLKDIVKTYEGDISYCNKFVIDNVKEMLDSNYRVNYTDIETTSFRGFPDYHNPVESIISLSCFDSYINKPISWIWHPTYVNETIERIFNDIKVEIRRFSNEKDMLNNYVDFIQETQPDYFANWNVLFDINYLAARLENLEIDLSKLSPLYNTKFSFKLPLYRWNKNSGMMGKRMNKDVEDKTIKIVGLQYFDLLSSYKNIVASEKPSWKLDDIAKEELGITKLRTHFDIGEKWKDDPEFIEEYNYIDVLLVKKLDDKLKILQRYNSIKDRVYLHNINDVFSSGKVLDNYILKKYKDIFIFPTKTYDSQRDSRIGGGYVREPKAGIYDNVAVFDFSGFYPNLMLTFNLSGEKLIKEDVTVFDTEIDEQDKISLEDKMYEYDETKKEITYNIITDKFKGRLTYKLDDYGVMTQAVQELMKLRNLAKKEMKKHKYGSLEYEQHYRDQFSYKFLINANYGVNAYPGFRLFKLNNANAITAFGRAMNKYISNCLEKIGYQILLNDTDSIFIKLKESKTLQENLIETEKINKIINQEIEIFVRKYLPEEYAVKHTLKMEMEKIYNKLLLLDVKKRYIGFLKYYDGQETEKLHYMGLDLKKSNTIELCKKAQMDFAISILKDEDIDLTLNKYYSILKNSKDINLFKISSKLEKQQNEYIANIPVKRATLWSNEKLKTKFRGGTKFYIMYVKENKDCNTDVIAFEDENQLKNLNIEINKEKYFEDLHSKLDNLVRGIPKLKNLNDTYQIKYQMKQNSLNSFL